MKKRYMIVAVLVLNIMAAGTVWAAPPVAELLQKMDDVETLGIDVTIKFTLVETKVNQGTGSQEGIFYRRDRDDAYLIVFTAPTTNKGNGYLRVGDSMWMYRRNTRSFQLMSRNQSVEGSDICASDLETPKYATIYEPALDAQGQEIVNEETLGDAEIPVYRFTVQAKIDNVDYPTKVYWIRQDNFLKLKAQSYSASGTLMQTTYYPKYTQIQGRSIAVKLLVLDEFEKGNKSLLELSGISLDSIDDSVFTKAYLENLSK